MMDYGLTVTFVKKQKATFIKLQNIAYLNFPLQTITCFNLASHNIRWLLRLESDFTPEYYPRKLRLTAVLSDCGS